MIAGTRDRGAGLVKMMQRRGGAIAPLDFMRARSIVAHTLLLEDDILLIDPALEASRKFIRGRVVATTTGKGGLSTAAWIRKGGTTIQEVGLLNVEVIDLLLMMPTDMFYGITVNQITQKGSFGEVWESHQLVML